MTQLAFTTDTKLEHYAGYSFGWLAKAESRGALPYVSAVVTVPRYAARVAREIPGSIPVVLDNGAFPAFSQKLDPYQYSLADVWREMREASEILGDRVRWVVVPDVVGNPNLTWRRIEDSIRSLHWRFPRHKCLIPVQENMRLADVVHIARYYGGGVFIGGRERRWKFSTAQRIKSIAPDLHVHIARISAEEHLQYACWVGADSFDTTSYYYGMGNAPRLHFGARLERYCEPRPLSYAERMARICYYN